MKFAHLLAEILQRGYGTRNLLYLVQNQECFTWDDLTLFYQLYFPDDALHVEIIIEYGGIVAARFKIDIAYIVEAGVAKLFQRMGLATLTHSRDQ